MRKVQRVTTNLRSPASRLFGNVFTLPQQFDSKLQTAFVGLKDTVRATYQLFEREKKSMVGGAAV